MYVIIPIESWEIMRKEWLSKGKVIIYCITLSFLFLMICSESSFLYPMNDWVDGNCFFTMGKSMFQGKVLYVDLFDQKGPLLFLYYGIASLISYTTFFGVFLIEVISFSIFLYYAYRLCRLYLKKETSLLTLPIISFLILTLPAFTHGGSVEEFSLPMLMYSLYSMVKFLKSGDTKPKRSMIFINGIMAGLIATMKFTLLGFWFAWMASMFFYLLSKKEWKESILDCLIFLSGMAIPIIPWLIYFGIHHAIGTWIESYVIFNIKYYPTTDTWIMKLFDIITKPLFFMTQNLGFGIPFMIGICVLLFDRFFFKKKSSKWIVISLYCFLCLGVFCGGISFRYYYFILAPFLIFGIVAIASWIERLYHIEWHESRLAHYMIYVTLLVALSYYGCQNTNKFRINQSRQDLVQYQFAEIIKQTENPTLLNYGFLDGGFYTTTGIIPNIRYFQKQNIANAVFPENIEQQEEAIKKKKVDFVVTRVPIDKGMFYHYIPELKQNYKKISEKNQKYEEHRYRYTLWQKK